MIKKVVSILGLMSLCSCSSPHSGKNGSDQSRSRHPNADAESVVVHEAPNKVQETADQLVLFPYVAPDIKLNEKGLFKTEAWYSTDDAEKIEELANIDFYAATGPTAVGIAPKLHNTSAALEIYELIHEETGQPLNKQEFETDPTQAGLVFKSGKYRNDRKAKKIAKLKTSGIAESGLLGFHLSRLLGNIGEAPPVIYRTMSVESLKHYGKRAQEFMQIAKSDNISLNPHIEGAWETVMTNLNNPKSSTIVPGNSSLVYASMAINPRGESNQDLFNNATDDMPYFRLLKSNNKLDQELPDLMSAPKDSSAFKKAFQLAAYARDFSSAMIFDEIMHQEDRFGNFNKISLAHTIGNKSGRLETKRVKADKAIPPGVVVDRMLLKDNDDGLKKNPSQRIVNFRKQLRHLDPLVYGRLQWLAGLLREATTEPQVKKYFLENVHLRMNNYEAIKTRILALADLMKAEKDSGKLLLDLDLEDILRKAK